MQYKYVIVYYSIILLQLLLSLLLVSVYYTILYKAIQYLTLLSIVLIALKQLSNMTLRGLNTIRTYCKALYRRYIEAIIVRQKSVNMTYIGTKLVQNGQNWSQNR